MESLSFKPTFRYRSETYRTPSPPPFEFLTPLRQFPRERKHTHPTPSLSSHPYTEDDFAGGNRRRVEHNGWNQFVRGLPIEKSNSKQNSPSRLDLFAAVATSPREPRVQTYDQPLETENDTFHWNYASPSRATDPLQYTGFDEHTRAAKRIKSINAGRSRSERMKQSQFGGALDHFPGRHHYHPDSHQFERANGNPATVSDASFQDAELLLSFAKGSVAQVPFPQRNATQQYLPATTGHVEPVVSAVSVVDDYKIDCAVKKAYETFQASSQANGKLEARSLQTYPDSALGLGIHWNGPPHESSTEALLHDSPLDQSQETKPRVHRGWPKGKPRGSRPHGTPAKKRDSAGAKKGSVASTGGDAKAAKRRPARPSNKASSKDFPNPTPNAHVPDVFGHLDDEREAAKRRFSMSALPTAPPHFHPTTKRHPSAPPSLSLSSAASASDGLFPSSDVNGAIASVNMCAGCKSTKATVNGYRDLWISCNGCKEWFHYVCAGFKSEREVRDVDKYYCTACEPQFGATTTVRKSGRAHVALDYAGLNEGVVRTNDDVLEHHFIKSIKAGVFKFNPETFPRMPPDIVTAEYFEAIGGMNEPILIPADLNPRPSPPAEEKSTTQRPSDADFKLDLDYDCVPDDGQDKLDMVMPQGLTVRHVCDLYGADEKIDVINVKNQSGEDKQWTMRRWADYYEAVGEKPVRNVISLEFSWSRLGKLVRRPKIARDLDLQDLVWPAEEQRKGNLPKSVQFYCLMSVADSYTDFHIDFGGSSVYYHILKGKKTFFFIPPKLKHLKKYEEWCNSKDQNHTWLPDMTHECYRVDLSEGDTMLIPSGWIHSVWTPETSLVVGGNFLTRLHYGMQIRIAEIEKNTKVPRKFRYPFFQKVMWFAVIDYLESDPVPSSVVALLYRGQIFERKKPIWSNTEDEEVSGNATREQYNARYYSQPEVEGWSALVDYALRTVKISLRKVDGVTKELQAAVARSLPKGYGEPFMILQTFVLWVAWKRGNEVIPMWALPGSEVPSSLTPSLEKKANMKATVAKDGATATADRRSSRLQDVTKPAPATEEQASADFVQELAVKEPQYSQPPYFATGETRFVVEERLGIRLSAPDERPAEFYDTGVSAASPKSYAGAFAGVVIDSKPRPPTASPSPPPMGEASERTHGSPLQTPPDSVTDPASEHVHSPEMKVAEAESCDSCGQDKTRCIHSENSELHAETSTGQDISVHMTETTIRKTSNIELPSMEAMNGVSSTFDPSASSLPTPAQDDDEIGNNALMLSSPTTAIIKDEPPIEASPESLEELSNDKAKAGLSTGEATGPPQLTLNTTNMRAEHSQTPPSSPLSNMDSPLSNVDSMVLADESQDELAIGNEDAVVSGARTRRSSAKTTTRVETTPRKPALRQTPARASKRKFSETQASADEAPAESKGSPANKNTRRGAKEPAKGKTPVISKKRSTSFLDGDDEDSSLKLARQLAAEDLGLRRRGR